MTLITQAGLKRTLGEILELVPPQHPRQLARCETRPFKLAENARGRFTAFMGDKGIPFREVAVASQEPTAWWTELEGDRGQIVGSYGRLFELIIAGREIAISVDQTLTHDLQVLGWQQFENIGLPRGGTRAARCASCGSAASRRSRSFRQ